MSGRLKAGINFLSQLQHENRDTYIYISLCVHVRFSLSVYVCVCARACICMCTFMCVHAHACMFVHACMRVDTCLLSVCVLSILKLLSNDSMLIFHRYAA